MTDKKTTAIHLFRLLKTSNFVQMNDQRHLHLNYHQPTDGRTVMFECSPYERGPQLRYLVDARQSVQYDPETGVAVLRTIDGKTIELVFSIKVVRPVTIADIIRTNELAVEAERGYINDWIGEGEAK